MVSRPAADRGGLPQAPMRTSRSVISVSDVPGDVRTWVQSEAPRQLRPENHAGPRLTRSGVAALPEFDVIQRDTIHPQRAPERCLESCSPFTSTFIGDRSTKPRLLTFAADVAAAVAAAVAIIDPFSGGGSAESSWSYPDTQQHRHSRAGIEAEYGSKGPTATFAPPVIDD